MDKLNLSSGTDASLHQQVTKYALIGGQVYVHGLADEHEIDLAKEQGAIEEEPFLI